VKRDWQISVAAVIGTLAVRLLAATWRIRWRHHEYLDDAHRKTGPLIYVLWHGQLLPLLYAHRKRHIAVMVSEHRDGEIIARVAKRLGFRTVRGSTFKGAARALLGACREIEDGADVAVTVDGPRGPAHVVAPGSLVISQRTGAPMIPVVASASRAWRFSSWDRFMVPKPFARVTVSYGPTVAVRAASARDAANEAADLGSAIQRAEEELRQHELAEAS
jgi:lysophospholipid acyltransferase (LPLAT)-like uncharacterized protein